MGQVEIKNQIQPTKFDFNMQKLNNIADRANILLLKAKKPAQKQKIVEMLKIIQDRQTAQKTYFLQKNHKSGINVICLSQSKVFKPWRQLTEIEQKTNFKYLNESFNNLEAEMEAEMWEIIKEDIQKNVKKIEGKIKAGDIAAIAAMSFISFNKLYPIVAEYYKRAFEVGKKTGSEEIGVDRPITPTKKIQLINFGAAQITEDFINQINSEAKEKAKNGLIKDIAIAGLIASINDVVQNGSKDFVNKATGEIISEGINDGRRLVFEKNITELQGYERSEILDDRTCNICYSLDGRQIKADDPMAKLDQVHNNCRGLWIPITLNEEADNNWGIPKSITERFETIGGVPEKNNFKQLKSPIK